MMHLNGLLGHWQAWVLIALAWFWLAALSGWLFGLIAKVGQGRAYIDKATRQGWRERRGEK